MSDILREYKEILASLDRIDQLQQESRSFAGILLTIIVPYAAGLIVSTVALSRMSFSFRLMILSLLGITMDVAFYVSLGRAFKRWLGDESSVRKLKPSVAMVIGCRLLTALYCWRQWMQS